MVLEFDRIFNDLFGSKGSSYKKVLYSLKEGSKTLAEIRKHAGFGRGGNLSDLAEDLIIAGFASSLGPKGVNLMQFWFIKNGLQLSDEICQIFLIFDLPKKCCGKNVKFTPINVSQKCILPKNSLYCLPEILPIQ